MIYHEGWAGLLWDSQRWGFAWAGAETVLVELEEVQTWLGPLWGLSVGSSYCLSWNTLGTEDHGKFFHLPYFEQLFPPHVGSCLEEGR